MVTDLKLLSSIKYLKLLESFELYSFSCTVFKHESEIRNSWVGWIGPMCDTSQESDLLYDIQLEFFLKIGLYLRDFTGCLIW